MGNALLIIAGLIVAVFAALAAVPHLVDWNGYRGVFEEEATRILGREVRVGGAVNVRFLPAPYASFEKVRIADPTGFSGEPFFRVESFTLWLSAPPLLRGVLEANKIELKRPVLRLALDDQGAGNWSRLSITRGALPFVPAGVTLQSARILDGVLAVHAPNGRQLLRLEDLGGELAADSLDGPYKFKGSARWRGAEREIRLATSEPQPDGTVRFKASVRAPESDNTYTLDGRASDLRTRPRIEGELTARIAVAAKPGEGAVQIRADAADERPTFDARGHVEADAAELRLKDVAMTLEQAGQPQLVTGEATLAWRKEMRLDLALASRWLDLDRISGGEDASPAETARRLMTLGAVLPAEGQLGVRINVDQANVGGELIGGLRIELARAPGGIVVKELKAQLPGTTRLDLSGAIAATSSDDRPVTGFVGDIAVKGASLARFAGWLGKSRLQPEARSDGPFSLQGKLGLSDSTFELADAAGEIAGTPLKGELRYESGKRRRLSLEVEGQRIDADQLLPRGAVPAELGAILPFAGDPQASADRAADGSGKRGWFDPAATDVRLRVRADELLARGQMLRNVDADLTLERGRLTIPALKLATTTGLALDAEGEFTNLGAEPVGRLKGVLEAAQPDALPSLATLVGLDPAMGAVRRIGALAPLRVAGTLSLGERAPGAADVSFDGTVHGGRVSATARFDRATEIWSKTPTDVTFTAESPDVERLLAALLPTRGEARPEARQAGAKPRPGQVFVKVVGTPAEGLVSLATVKAEALSLAYDGRIGVSAAARAELDGRVQITAERVGSVVALAGLPLSEAAAAVPIEGSLDVALKEGTLRLRPRGLELGGASVSGSLAVSRAEEEGPLTLDGELIADEARLGRLLALLTRDGSAAPDSVPGETQSVWPDAPFDLTWADDLNGRVALRLGRLALDSGLALADARAEAVLERGGTLQTTITGKALGGAVEARARFERAAAGVNASVDLRLGDVRLELLAPGDDARPASGTASLMFAASGQALSPAALVAALDGRGEVRLGEAELEGLAPVGVAAAADAVLAGRTAASGDALFAALRSELHSGKLELGPREIPIEVRSGAVRLQAFTVETPEGRTTVETTVDLGLLKFDSEWRIEPAAPPRPRAGGGRAELPAVSVYYVGSLRDFADLEPRLSYSSFERELTVRRMEREVEELERLRKGDEDRVRQERARKDDQEWMRQERQRALDRPRTGAEAPAPEAGAVTGSTQWRPTVVGPTGTTPTELEPAHAEPVAPGPAAASPGAETGGTSAAPPPVPAQRRARGRLPSDEILRQISPY